MEKKHQTEKVNKSDSNLVVPLIPNRSKYKPFWKKKILNPDPTDYIQEYNSSSKKYIYMSNTRRNKLMLAEMINDKFMLPQQI